MAAIAIGVGVGVGGVGVGVEVGVRVGVGVGVGAAVRVGVGVLNSKHSKVRCHNVCSPRCHNVVLHADEHPHAKYPIAKLQKVGWTAYAA